MKYAILASAVCLTTSIFGANFTCTAARVNNSGADPVVVESKAADVVIAGANCMQAFQGFTSYFYGICSDEKANDITLHVSDSAGHSGGGSAPFQGTRVTATLEGAEADIEAKLECVKKP